MSPRDERFNFDDWRPAGASLVNRKLSATWAPAVGFVNVVAHGRSWVSERPARNTGDAHRLAIELHAHADREVAREPKGRAKESAPAMSSLDRAARYLEKLPPSIQGSNGSGALFTAAQCLVRGFSLSDEDALNLLQSTFNPRCVPLWTTRELKRVVMSARRRGKMPMGALANAPRRAA